LVIPPNVFLNFGVGRIFKSTSCTFHDCKLLAGNEKIGTGKKGFKIVIATNRALVDIKNRHSENFAER
jgi:hypothetical protein